MSTHRQHLPQLTSKPFLTDGGLETTLVFDHGYDLPAFAAFDLFRRPEGYGVLRDYYLKYLQQARTHGAGFILESPTWRASRDWGAQLGYTPSELVQINRKAIAMLVELRQEWLDRMEKFFAGRGRPMPENNRKQAMLPTTSELIDNPVGTACGFALNIGQARFFFTPGVPRELHRMLDDEI